MTHENIVAVFDTAQQADAAIQALKEANVPPDAITRHAHDSTDLTTSTSDTAESARPGFWSSLFGGDLDHDEAVYGRSMAQGSTVVMVRTPDEHVASVTQILERFNPVDLDERATSYGLAGTGAASPAGTAATSGTTGTTAAATATDAAASGGKIELAAENLKIGKRLVNRGTTRIRRFVVETPVEEQVTLRTERVDVERHPVGDARPVTNADFAEKVIEVTETAEEPVVSKEARVVEEVNVRKEAAERVETVRDTVRREDVEIEKVPGTAQTTTAPAGKPR